MLSRRAFIKSTIAGLGSCYVAQWSAVADAKSVAELAVIRRNAVVAWTTFPPDIRDEHLSTDGKTYFIDSVDLQLDQSHIPGSGALVVRADTVTLSSDISLPGRDLTILARVITISPGVKIITDGPPAATDYSGQKAPDGQSAGASGSTGRTALNGNNGGDITLFADRYSGSVWVSANGSNGGSAESGGNGLKGLHGVNWSLGMPHGGNGGSGGDAGMPGAPGGGGSGGRVVVGVLSSDSPLPQLKGSVKRAAAGDPGKPGNPGDPGDAGNGGSHTFCRPSHTVR